MWCARCGVGAWARRCGVGAGVGGVFAGQWRAGGGGDGYDGVVGERHEAFGSRRETGGETGRGVGCVTGVECCAR